MGTGAIILLIVIALIIIGLGVIVLIVPFLMILLGVYLLKNLKKCSNKILIIFLGMFYIITGFIFSVSIIIDIFLK